MSRPIVKVTFFAALVAFILWIISRVREDLASDPFSVED